MAGKPGKGGVGGLLRDKRVLIGAAVAAGAGLLALLMRKQGGASTVQPAATLDSSGTDLYNGLQDISSAWRNDLQGFADQLQNITDRLPQQPGTGTGQVPGVTYQIPPVEQQPRALAKLGPLSRRPGSGSLYQPN